MSSIMKGIVDEGEEVVVIYIDGKPSTKYAKKHEAEMDAARMREKFPSKKIEVKQEVRETEAIKGADGKRCWKGKRYAGTENGKDKCIPVKEESDDQEKLEIGKRVWLKNQTHANSPIHGKLHSLNDTHAILNTGGRYYRAKRDNVTHDRDQSFLNAYKNDDKIKAKTNEGVIVGHDAKDPEVAILGGAGTMSLSRLRDKAIAEARQLSRDLAQTANFKAAAHNIKQLANTLNTIVAAENEMEKSYFGEDYTGEFAAEVTPATNPYGGLKDRQHRGAISEDRGTLEVGYQLQDLAHEIKELADNAMRLVRGTPEEGRARSYWYPHIVMAVSEDHGYMGRNMFTMIDSAESLINGEEDDEYIDEMPDTSGPVGTQPGGWRTYSPKQAGQVDESRMHQYDINDAIKKLEAYSKSENYSSKVSSTRLANVLRNWQNQTDNGIVTRAQLLRTPNMGKQAMALLDTLMGNTSNDTDPMIQNKKQSLAIVDSLKQAIASDDMQSILDLLRELKNSIGAMDRLSYKKVKEDTAYATGMGQGGAAGQSYRKFKPKSAGTFKEEQLDEKCWDTHKQVGMKKKGDKMVPNCVPKESAIMKGLKR